MAFGRLLERDLAVRCAIYFSGDGRNVVPSHTAGGRPHGGLGRGHSIRGALRVETGGARRRSNVRVSHFGVVLLRRGGTLSQASLDRYDSRRGGRRTRLNGRLRAPIAGRGPLAAGIGGARRVRHRGVRLVRSACRGT